MATTTDHDFVLLGVLAFLRTRISFWNGSVPTAQVRMLTAWAFALAQTRPFDHSVYCCCRFCAAETRPARRSCVFDAQTDTNPSFARACEYKCPKGLAPPVPWEIKMRRQAVVDVSQLAAGDHHSDFRVSVSFGWDGPYGIPVGVAARPGLYLRGERPVRRFHRCAPAPDRSCAFPFAAVSDCQTCHADPLAWIDLARWLAGYRDETVR